MPYHYNFLVFGLLQRATEIEELELHLTQGSVPEDTSILPKLKKLSLHHGDENTTPDSRIVSTFLINKPQLLKLNLSNYNSVDDSTSGAVLNVRELCMVHSSDRNAFNSLTIRTLAKAMPQLESFSIRYYSDQDPFVDVSDILNQLLVRMDTLKSLKLDRCNFTGEIQSFKKLVKLKKLDLCIPMIGEHSTFEFPDNLRCLVVYQWVYGVEYHARALNGIRIGLSGLKGIQLHAVICHIRDRGGPQEIIKTMKVQKDMLR